MGAALGVLAAAVVAQGEASASGKFVSEGVRVGAPPEWVEVDAAEVRGDADRHPAGGVNFHLVKHHFRPGENAVYSRFLLALESESGVDENSTLYWNFDPDFEEIRLHWVRIRREGEVIDLLSDADIDVVDARTEVSSWFYDDSKDIRIILKDVRVGDVLDYAVTRTGSNPVVGDRFAQSASLGYGVPVDRIEVRLDWPVERSGFRWRTHPEPMEPDVEQEDGERIYRWTVEDAPAHLTSDGTPPGYGPPWVEFSDWRSWGGVADWADALYQNDGPLPMWVAEAVGEIRERELPPLEAATEVLQLIQDSIRYVAIPVGPHSYQPYSPEEIAARRYGDCKDMSQLLVLALRELGIEADPVLVNSRQAGTISRWLPSPRAFDHVVVGAKIEGRRVWMDPTYGYQGGILPKRFFPDYEVGLRVSDETNGLEEGVGPQAFAESLIDSEESLVFEEYRAPVDLTVVTRYAGDEADFMRERIAADGIDSLRREFGNYYAELFGGMLETKPLEVEDRREENVIVVREGYRLPSLFGDDPSEPGFRTFTADQISDRLSTPVERIREQPYSLYIPNHARQTIRLALPDDSVFADEQHEVANKWFRYTLEVRQEGNLLELRHEIEFLEGLVVPSEIDDYIAAVEEVRLLVDYSIEVEAVSAGSGLVKGLVDAFRRSSAEDRPKPEAESDKRPREEENSVWPLASVLIFLAFVLGIGIGRKNS